MTVNSLEIALVVQFVVFGGAIAGLLVGRRLPPHHLSAETRTAVSASMAVVGTISALVISLLISSGSTAFTARNRDVAALASEIIRLDTLLRRYGQEADSARNALRHYATAKLEDLFQNRQDQRPDLDVTATLRMLDEVQDRLLTLKPDNDRARWVSTEALQLTVAVSETQARLSLENVNSLPLPFLGALILWLTVLFVSFGLFAPRNVTAVIALFLCAFAISAAVKLVLDMDTPFSGRILLSPPPIHISSDPMRRAIEVIGQRSNSE